jgi:hypothetical protein
MGDAAAGLHRQALFETRAQDGEAPIVAERVEQIDRRQEPLAGRQHPFQRVECAVAIPGAGAEQPKVVREDGVFGPLGEGALERRNGIRRWIGCDRR